MTPTDLRRKPSLDPWWHVTWMVAGRPLADRMVQARTATAAINRAGLLVLKNLRRLAQNVEAVRLDGGPTAQTSPSDPPSAPASGRSRRAASGAAPQPRRSSGTTPKSARR